MFAETTFPQRAKAVKNQISKSILKIVSPQAKQISVKSLGQVFSNLVSPPQAKIILEKIPLLSRVFLTKKKDCR
jgi:hypothetical protein